MPFKTFRIEGFIHHFVCHQSSQQQLEEKKENLSTRMCTRRYTHIPFQKLDNYNLFCLISYISLDKNLPENYIWPHQLVSKWNYYTHTEIKTNQNLKQTASFPQLWFLDLWQHLMHFLRPDVNSLSRQCVTFYTAEQENKGSYIQLRIEIPHGTDLLSIL